MPIKASDLFDRIVRDDLPGTAPRTLDELHKYISAARQMFHKEMVGKYFIREGNRTLVIDQADMHGFGAYSFSPPNEQKGSLCTSCWCTSIGFDTTLFFDDSELTPQELEDLRNYGQAQSKKDKPKGAW